MRYSRIVRLIMRLFLLVLASTMSFISFLGGYSALLILSHPENIDLDVSFEGDLLTDPENFKVEVEFEINNQGYFDLEDLDIEFELEALFYLNKSGTGFEPEGIPIYEADKSFSTIEAGHKEKNKITIEYEDLLNVNWSYILPIIDLSRVIKFTANDVEISAKYTLGLISFKVEIDEIKLGDYEV